MSATAPRDLPPLPRGALAFWASVLAGFSLVMGIVARSWPHNLIYFGAGAAAILLSFAGSAFTLPLYFCTTFGTEILVPGLPVSLNRALALLLALAAGNEFLRGRSRIKVTPALVLMVLFHVYILAAAFIKLPENGEMFIQPAFYLVIALIVALNAWRESWRMSVLWTLFVSSIAICGIGYLEFVVGGDITLKGIEPMPRGAIRINGISRDAIQFGFNASWGGFIGLYLLTRVRGAILPQLVAVGTAVTLLAAVLTLNRQVPFILGAMLATFVFLCRWQYRRHLAVALIAGAAALTPVVGWKIFERIIQAQSHVGDPSFAIRYDKAMIGAEMIAANPLTGIGHNYFQYLYRDYRPIGKTVLIQDDWTSYHTVDLGYLQLVVEYGIIGAALWVVMILAFALMLRRARAFARRTGDGDMMNYTALLAGLVVQLLVSQFLQDTFGIVRTYILMGLILATAVWLAQHRAGIAEEATS